MSYEDFVRDDKTIFAVIRGMRNKVMVIHGYLGVDTNVWDTVKKRIPEVKKAL